jgi:hypothetical protein
MTKEEAKRAVLRDWIALPSQMRKTQVDALVFAMSVKDKYRFRCSGDRYQVIKGWLQDRIQEHMWPS